MLTIASPRPPLLIERVALLPPLDALLVLATVWGLEAEVEADLVWTAGLAALEDLAAGWVTTAGCAEDFVALLEAGLETAEAGLAATAGWLAEDEAWARYWAIT